jgi:hypothetical protein
MKLPVEFKGIWYSPHFGGFSPNLLERFKEEYPNDWLDIALCSEESQKYNEEHELRPYKSNPHKHAEPTWISKNEFEKEYGKIIYIELLVDKIPEGYDDNRNFIIWTENNVIQLEEYDGLEYFTPMPRNPPKEE